MLERNVDFNWVPTTGTIVLSNTLTRYSGDSLVVYIRHQSDYLYGYFDSSNTFVETPGTIYFDNQYLNNSNAVILSMTNTGEKTVQRQRIRVKDLDGVSETSDDYEILANIQMGRIILESQIGRAHV